MGPSFSRPQRFMAIRNLLLGGLLPLVAFTIVEAFYGTKGGVVAGLAFGGGEILWEHRRLGKVQSVTWLSNALLLALGLASLWEGGGLYFKLQPAFFLLVFAVVLLGTSATGRHFLVAVARKQNPSLPPEAVCRLQGINGRLGLYFLVLAALAAYSAFYWSTASWAALKAAGLPALLALYIGGELLWARIAGRRSL